MTQCPACSYEWRGDQKRRSIPQHRRYFGMIRAAYENWPEGHPLKPIDAEQVRWYLQLRAGWGTPVIGADGATYMIPKSVSFSKMSADQFGELCDRVSRIIGEIIGLDGDELLLRQSEVA